MRFPTRSRNAEAPPGLIAPARVDRRPASLAARLETGAIAVTDAVDLDRAGARALLDAGAAAVISASPLFSGRYPAHGPLLLVEAGIEVVEDAGPEVLGGIRDGAKVRLHAGTVYAGDRVVATGRKVGPDDVRRDMDAARAGLASQLESFAHDTREVLRLDQDLLLDGEGLPGLGTTVAGRHVVVVVDGHDAAAELSGIKHYLRETRPVMIAVDRAADAVLAARRTPDVVVLDGQADALPAEEALREARAVVVRVDPGSEPATTDRLARLGVRPHRLETTLTSEDVAILIASAGDAAPIVGVGMSATLDDFLDRSGGMASTWLTRLRAGADLVDARAVAVLYTGRVRPWQLLLALVLGLLAVVAAIATTPAGQEWWDQLAIVVEGWFAQLRGWLP